MATDDRVVAMSFENDQFNSGVSSTIGVIGKLKEALNFGNAAQGLEDLNNAGQRVDLSHISTAVQAVSGSFSVLGGAAAVALGNVATKAIEVGAEVTKSLTLDPIIEGFHNYETRINAVQTIMANTGLTGAAGLGQVNAVLKDMQNYANLTVYNFSEMAQNIGTFTAAGVGLKDAQESIKGIANLAALSGSSSQQASSAMYQLSQAIAAGKVQLQDWNSVVNAGIGGRVFQEALFNTAKAMGTLKDVPLSETFDQWKAAGNSFRQSLQQNQSTVAGSTTAVDKLAQAHKDAATAIADAERSAATSVENAAQQVKTAQQGVADAARNAATATSNAADGVKSAQQAEADTVRQASRDIASALDGVKQAQQGLVNAHRQAGRDIANAVQQEHDAITQGAQSVQQALDSVVLARQRLADAMKPPSADELQAAQDRLTSAQLGQQQLADAVTLAQQQQTRAAQDLVIAQQNLQSLQNSATATPDQLLMAQRAVQDAQQKVEDLTNAQTQALLNQRAAARGVDQAQQDLQNTQQKGTDQDKNVQSAQDALTKALTAYQDAQVKAQDNIVKSEQNVRDVRVKSAQAQLQAQTTLTRAEQNLTDVRIKSAENERKAQDAIVKAEQNLANVRITSAESQMRAAQSLAQAEHNQANVAITSQESVAKAHEQAAKSILATEASLNPKRGGRGMDTWLTSDVLTQTLKQFSGDMTDAQLKAQGFTDAQIAHIDAMGKTAINSATQIKTFSQLMQALKEEVGTAWGSVFTTIFGDIGQAKALFSPLHTTVENFLTGPIYGLNNVLKDWAKAGGRTALIDAFKNAWTAVGDVLHVVRQAWDAIFPPESGSQLANITKGFEAFTKSLIPSQATLNDLKRIFEGVFAALDIGRKIIGDVIHIFEHLFGVVGGPAGGGFLSILASIGDFLVRIDKSLSSGGISSGISSLTANLHPLHDITTAVHDVWEKFLGILHSAGPILQPLIQGLSNLFGSVGNFLSGSLQNLDFTQVLHAIEVGFLGGIFLMFKRFFGGNTLKDIVGGLGGGLFGSIKETLEGVTGALKAMQTDLKANALLQIGIAVGLLAAALVALSTIPKDRLDTATTAMTIMMGQLLLFMNLLNKIAANPLGGIKLIALAGGLILVSGAIDLLAAGVKELAGLNWNQLEKGLTAVGVLLAEIAVAMGPISSNSAGMITAGIGIMAIATAMVILSHAVADFGKMDLATLAKGLGAVGAALVGIALAAKLFPTGGMVALGLGLIGISTGIRILVGAIVEMGNLKMSQLVQGLIGLGGALAAVALGMYAMPPGLALQGAGLLIVAAALGAITVAIEAMGHMSMDNLAKGLLGLGLSLTVLGTALNLMDGALPGAAALAVAAGAMALLAPAIIALGSQDIGSLVVGLGALAGALTILGVAGTVLAPTAPALLALGVALLAIGGGLALAGAGVFLVATGISALAVSAPAAILIITKTIDDFVTAIPKFVSGVVTALLNMVTALAKAAPQFVTALGQILVALAQAVIKAVPQIVVAFDALVQGALKAVRDNFPNIVKMGLDMLVSLLSGIQDHIGQVTTHAIGIVTTFLGTIANHLPKIVTSGLSVLVHFLSGIADNIGHVVAAAINVVTHFIGAVASHIGDIVNSGVNLIVHFISAIATGEVKMLKAGISIITHFLSGVASEIPHIVTGAANIVAKFISSVATAALGLVDEGAKTIINFLNGIATAIRKYEPQLWAAGSNIASAMIDGMVQGIENLAPKLINKIGDLISALPDKALKLLGISSPSRVFAGIGENVVSGLVMGINNAATKPVAAMEDLTNNVIDAAANSMQSFSQQITDVLNFQSPTITPVLNLDQLQKDAALIPDYITASSPIIGNFGLLNLAAPGQGQQDTSGSNTNNTGPSGGGIYFTQNNYSPESLPAIEIYRQTNNQLSQISSYGSDAAYAKKTGG